MIVRLDAILAPGSRHGDHQRRITVPLKVSAKVADTFSECGHRENSASSGGFVRTPTGRKREEKKGKKEREKKRKKGKERKGKEKKRKERERKEWKRSEKKEWKRRGGGRAWGVGAWYGQVYPACSQAHRKERVA